MLSRQFKKSESLETNLIFEQAGMRVESEQPKYIALLVILYRQKITSI